MEVYKTFQFSCGPNATAEGIVDMITSLCHQHPEWERDHDTEKNINRHGTHNYYCFKYSPNTEAPKSDAILFLIQYDDILKQANIVPVQGSLGFANYNSIVDNFHDTILQSVNPKLSVNVSSGAISIEDVCDESTISKLKLFSQTSNKATGSAHPMDFDKWVSFIISSFNNGANLDTHILERWLVEEEDWQQEIASELSRDYEFAIEVLKRYSEGE